MNKTLILDCNVFSNATPQLILEAEFKNKPVTISGILQRANVFNHNKRSYPKKILEREFNKYLIKVKERKSLGELDHPDETTISLRNVSHLISEIHWEGDDMCGTVEILSTPSGNIVKELIKSNVKIGISSRGLGTLKELPDDKFEVMDDFDLLCFDLVSEPSTHGAYMNLNESIMNSIDRYANINKLMQEIISDFTILK